MVVKKLDAGIHVDLIHYSSGKKADVLTRTRIIVVGPEWSDGRVQLF